LPRFKNVLFFIVIFNYYKNVIKNIQAEAILSVYCLMLLL